MLTVSLLVGYLLTFFISLCFEFVLDPLLSQSILKVESVQGGLDQKRGREEGVRFSIILHRSVRY